MVSFASAKWYGHILSTHTKSTIHIIQTFMQKNTYLYTYQVCLYTDKVYSTQNIHFEHNRSGRTAALKSTLCAIPHTHTLHTSQAYLWYGMFEKLVYVESHVKYTRVGLQVHFGCVTSMRTSLCTDFHNFLCRVPKISGGSCKKNPLRCPCRKAGVACKSR